MPNLSDTLETIVQRTGQSFDWTDPFARARFLSALQTDLAAIINQLNNVYVPLVEALVDDTALSIGIAGSTVYTDPDTGTDSANAYYDPSLARARTIKETFDFLLAQLAALQTVIVTDGTVDDLEGDLSALQDLVNTITLNLQQLRLDTQPSNYTFDADGEADLSFPLAQHIDALGAFFTGFPGVGGTYVASYPTLELDVALSDIDIDTTLAQSVITDLSNHLGHIRDFVGMTTVGPETPQYSDYGTITYVSDGQNLVEAVQTLDQAVAGIQVVDEFPGDVSGLTEQAKSYEVLLIGEYDGIDTTTTLTMDGEASSTSNTIFMPTNCGVSLHVSWTLFLADGGYASGGGKAIGAFFRNTAAAQGPSYGAVELEHSVAPTNNTTGIIYLDTPLSTAFTNNIIQFSPSAVGNGYVDVIFDWTATGLAIPGRVVAHVRVVQCRWEP